MGKNLKKLYSFRTEDWIMKKIEYIGEKNTRNRTQEIEHILKQHIQKYELENGKIEIDE